MKLLLISNSTNPNEEYLQYPVNQIGAFLGDIGEVFFVPYAAVTFSYDKYLEKVQRRFDDIAVNVRSAHEFSHPAHAVEKARAIVVGGGNTFALLRKMQETGLVEAIARRVKEGIPYVGWSAGSNVTCPTICTTNDMPIVQPQSFEAMNLIPFQINPHYLDAHPMGHAGETREQRIEEYIAANPGRYVVGLREGCMLHCEGHKLSLIGSRPARIFHSGQEPKELRAGDDFDFLLGR